MPDQLKIRVTEQMYDIHFGTGKIVVEADHLMSEVKQFLTEM
jgi:hypothetical protein